MIIKVFGARLHLFSFRFLFGVVSAFLKVFKFACPLLTFLL
ncbi:hypothetical protein D920_01264 [Enterococcus faecalis 13-SD-W-01]|nr:hypothetical protein D920_01264 [Enterococcus faecalis 13-SD-W-01]